MKINIKKIKISKNDTKNKYKQSKQKLICNNSNKKKEFKD